MNSRYKLWVVIFTLFLLGANTFAFGQTETSLSEALHNEECTRGCLLGIEAGVTSVQEVEEILTAQGIVYEFLSRSGLNTSLCFVPYSDTFRYFIRRTQESRVCILFGGPSADALVEQISIPIDVSVEDLVADLGLPNKIVYLENDGRYNMYMMYDALQVTMMVPSGFAGTVTVIYLHNDHIYNSNRDYLDVATTCFDVIPAAYCVTATPVPVVTTIAVTAIAPLSPRRTPTAGSGSAITVTAVPPTPTATPIR